jgi:glycosyltransferase involved in cell wall biosynthesis
MNVLVVAEYYPRGADPVLGIWAHRQALAARAAGAEVRVLVLYRPLPSLATVRGGDIAAAYAAMQQPRETTLDGIPVTYLRYLTPPRPWSYGTWGAWAAGPLRRAFGALRSRFPFDLVHAHNAVPAGDAVRRALPGAPLVISVHGGDLYGTLKRRAGGRAVRDALGHARVVVANSAGTAERCLQHGARTTRVVHLGTDVPPLAARGSADRVPTLVTVGHLVARKRHAEVIASLPALRERHHGLRYVIVGDGPERGRLRALAGSLGVADAVELRGQLEHAHATTIARAASVFVLPSVDEAFGVAYIEAMAGGVPAVGCLGQDGPEEIAAAGAGISLVPPGDLEALTARIDELLCDRAARGALGAAARDTVQRAFTWEACGRATVAAYRDAL